jgi:hypothetical protein
MYTQMLLACCKVGQRQEYLAVAYHIEVQYTQRVEDCHPERSEGSGKVQ